MANDNKNFFIFVILFIIGFGLFYFYDDIFSASVLPSVFLPSQQFTTQYIGTIPAYGIYQWIYNHPYSVAQFSTANILDYKIVSEKFKTGTIYDFLGCKANDCNGNIESTDSYGCNIYKMSSPLYQVWLTDIHCSSGSWWLYRIRTSLATAQQEINRNDGICGRIVTITSCGGANLKTIKSGGGCYSSHKVYYKGNLMYETGIIASVVRKDFKEGVLTTNQADSDLHIDFQNADLYFGSPTDLNGYCVRVSGSGSCPGSETECANTNGCSWAGSGHISKGCSLVTNEYIVPLPSNAMQFEVDIPKNQVIKGEIIKANITVVNNWIDTTGRLDILINIPYTVFGEQKQTSDSQSQFVSIKKGKTSFYFDLPTEQVTNLIYVTPTFNLLVPGNKFSGVNYYCFEQPDTKERDISQCQYVSFGTLEGSRFQLDVIPPPGFNGSMILDLEERLKQLQITSAEQASLISELDLTINQQADIISSMQLKTQEQGAIINNLQLTINEQADLITSLNLNFNDQLTIINNLNINLEQKKLLVNQLEITTTEQQSLINQMRGSFSEQANIINQLNLTIKDDAELIKSYKLSLEGQTEIINNLNLNINELTDLISQLELSNDDLIILVNDLKITQQQKQDIINQLQETIGIDVTESPSDTNWVLIGGIALAFIVLMILLSKKK